MAKFKTKAPFGIQTKRFAPIGFHPDLDPTGSMTSYKNKLGPGEYNPEKFECCYKKYNLAGSSWKRKTETEEFSKQLGFRNAEVLNQRRYYKSLGGPGNYDISEEVYKKKSHSVLNDVNFGNERRFFKLNEYLPPPGTYDKDIVKSSTVNKKQMTPLSPFEWDGFIDRFKRLNQPWLKAPNRYNPIDRGSMEALCAKVVSKKGPYNLFTGPRDNSTIKNHFTPPKKCTPDKFYTWANGLDFLLHHPSKRRCGGFLKEDRFTGRPTVRMLMNDLTTCYKDPDAPSPASYNLQVDGIRWMPETKYPFNDSIFIARKGIKWTIYPGPGRYRIRHPKCMKHKKASWVFKSTTGRTEYKAPNYSLYG